jgi:hypothetical protein
MSNLAADVLITCRRFRARSAKSPGSDGISALRAIASGDGRDNARGFGGWVSSLNPFQRNDPVYRIEVPGS